MTLDQRQLDDAIRHHQAGHVEQAYSMYQLALAGDPNNADVLSLLGAACIGLQRLSEAADHLHAALRSNPNHATAHDNLGVLLACQRQFAEAVASFQHAAQLNPASVATWMNLANALVRIDRSPEAIDAFRRAVQLAPDTLKAHEELVRLLDAAGRASEALPHRVAIARLKPADPRSQFESAAALAAAGQFEPAIAAYQSTLRLQPDSAETHVNLAQAYIALKRFDEAAASAQRAIALRPAFAEAHLNLASALSRLSRLDEAEAALHEALRLKPGLVESYINLGIVHGQRCDWPRAVAAYRQALALRPTDADAHYNIGIALLKQGDPQAAVGEFDAAIALRADYAEAHHNKAAALLIQGEFDHGLAEYEWRFRSRDFPHLRLRWPVWHGEPLAGRTIVLVAEQGLGDTIQFVRYAPLVARLGARVVVQCSAALQPLLAGLESVERWIDAKTECEADFCVPMLSLPHRLGTTLETIPRDVPYISADPARVERWRPRLIGQNAIFRVGIVWQGNPRAPEDAQRSIPLEHYAPLTHVDGVKLFSLQKGPGAEQLTELPERESIVQFGEALDAEGGAFLDTAAIMRQLDLVITSDTAAAHLAGALGVPTWVALPAVPDWRWLLGREDSPWYPTMRLFRQQVAGDWAEVFERIAAHLQAAVADR